MSSTAVCLAPGLLGTTAHHHSGLALFTPAEVFDGRAESVRATRRRLSTPRSRAPRALPQRPASGADAAHRVHINRSNPAHWASPAQTSRARGASRARARARAASPVVRAHARSYTQGPARYIDFLRRPGLKRVDTFRHETAEPHSLAPPTGLAHPSCAPTPLPSAKTAARFRTARGANEERTRSFGSKAPQGSQQSASPLQMQRPAHRQCMRR